MATHSPIAPIYDDLAALRRGWVMSGWSWDGRLSCVCSSFSADLAGGARGAIATAFSRTFDARSLSQAHPLVQAVAQQTGGVRSDQLVFTADPVAGTVAYGLWWPWGDDITISLRVGLAGLHADRELPNFQREFKIDF